MDEMPVKSTYTLYKSTAAGAEIDAATKAANRALLLGDVDPDGTTAGYLGQKYLNETSGKWFQLSEIDGIAFHWAPLTEFTDDVAAVTQQHIADENNPHGVTAAQIGAAEPTYVDSRTSITISSTTPAAGIWIEVEEETP